MEGWEQKNICYLLDKLWESLSRAVHYARVHNSHKMQGPSIVISPLLDHQFMYNVTLFQGHSSTSAAMNKPHQILVLLLSTYLLVSVA